MWLFNTHDVFIFQVDFYEMVNLYTPKIHRAMNMFNFLFRREKHALRHYSFLWEVMEETLNGTNTKPRPVFDTQGGINPTTLKQLCLCVLGREDVIMRLAHKMSGDVSSSESSFVEDDSAEDNVVPYAHVGYYERNTLFNALLHVSDIVIILSDVAKDIIEELNLGHIQITNGNVIPIDNSGADLTDTLSEVSSHSGRSSRTPEGQDDNPTNIFTHTSGFCVRGTVGVAANLRVDMKLLSEEEPTQDVSNFLKNMAVEICEDMTLLTAQHFIDRDQPKRGTKRCIEPDTLQGENHQPVKRRNLSFGKCPIM